MNRPTMLYQALLAQASMELDVSTERDFVEIRSRFEHEGLSFLTITLPRLSDCLESGLETGRLTCPPGFRRVHGTLPALLQGLFRRVFDVGGNLLPNVCSVSILWIRQIARFFKKPKLSCSPARERKAVEAFKQVEESLYHATREINRCDRVLDAVSAILWSSVFPTVSSDSFSCGHGPGATAERLRPNERRRIRYWYTRAEESMPSADFAFHNWGAAAGGPDGQGCSGLDYKDLRDEPAVRVVFVPKTLSTPRVIAIEPSSMQFMQQGVARYMMRTLERHDLTVGSVNFTDQSINQKLAYSASLDGSLATIDLSEASDRVHYELVRRIFARSPFLEYLEDLRSLHADLPDGSNILLKKYASMGSALCFPVEACVFYTLILSAIFSSTGKKPNYRSIHALMKRVKVYGDDLIVPVEHVDVVCDYLESYALRVNRRKTFSRSLFRESCGSDFYNGTSVNPVYARMDCPDDKSLWTPNHVMSWVSTANLFYERGWWKMATAVREMVQSVVATQIPISRHYLSAGLSFASCFQERNLVYDVSSHSWRQRRLTYTPVKTKDDIDGHDHTACWNLVFERNRSDGPGTLFGNEGVSGYPVDEDGRRRGLLVVPGSDNIGCHERASLQHPSRVDRVRDKWTFNGRHLFRVGDFESHESRNRFPRRMDEDRGLGLDFSNTTKRGTFRSKCRWVTLVA